MPAKPCFLGIDIHERGLDLLLLATGGQVIGSLQRTYAGAGQVPGLQDPQDWWRATRTGIKELLRRTGIEAGQIRSVGLTGTERALVLCDAEGAVLVPSAVGIAPELRPFHDLLVSSVGGRNFRNLTGSPPSDGSPVAKLLQVRESEPRAWHDLAMVFTARDFLRYRLTEQRWTDPSGAALTELYNPRSRAWSKQLLPRIGLTTEVLPQVGLAHQLAGRVTTTAARESGLQAATPVVTGASHPATLATVCGATQPGDALVELGDAGWLVLITDQFIKGDIDGHLRAGCHGLGDHWTLEGPGVTPGSGLRWLLEEVCTQEAQQAKRAKRPALDVLAELAAEVPPGADGLLYLMPHARSEHGGLIDLEPRHSRAQIIRAVLEGAALSLAERLAQAAEMGAPCERLLVAGPGAHNHLWCQMLADACDTPVTVNRIELPRARGAAVLASSAVGVYKGIDDAITAMAARTKTFKPRIAAVRAYREALERLAHARQALADHQPEETP